MPLSELAQEQQEAFHERLRELRLDPSKVVKKITPETHRGPVVLSADPRISSVPPTIVTVVSLDEVKRIAGNSDEHYEKGLMADHHEALPPWPAEKNHMDPSQLTAEENNLINAAEMGYIYGNSKNFSSYKTIIEKHKYPARFAVFAAEDVCIDSTNTPLIITSESAHNYGTVTICQGAQIVFEANATMSVQKMIKSTATKCS